MKLPYVFSHKANHVFAISNSPEDVFKVLRMFKRDDLILTRTISYQPTKESTGVDVGSWGSGFRRYSALSPEHQAIIDGWYNMVSAKLEDVI